MIKTYFKHHLLSIIIVNIITPLVFLSLYNLLTKDSDFSYFITGQIDEDALNESMTQTGILLPTRITCIRSKDQNYADLLQTKGFLDADILIIPLQEIEGFKSHLANSFAEIDFALQNLDNTYQLLEEDNHIYGLIITSSSIWQNDIEDPCVLVVNIHTQSYETALNVINQLLKEELIK